MKLVQSRLRQNVPSSNGSYGNLVDNLSESGSTPSMADEHSYSNDSMDILGSGHQREREKKLKKK